jgi:ADP-heptose:LPS heptosyltransferase
MDWIWTKAIPVEEHSHVVIRNRNLGRALGVDAGLIPRIDIEPHERERAEAMIPKTDKLVAIIPGSNIELAHKRWPVQHYRDLVRALIDHEIHPIILGGPDEERLGAEISAGFPMDRITDVVGKSDLGTAAAILSFCTLAVGNDGMLLHFAAAVGTRTIALFGPSDPAVYRPMGNDHVVLQSPLSCVPCYHLDTRGCINPRCMTILSPQVVINKTISMVGG